MFSFFYKEVKSENYRGEVTSGLVLNIPKVIIGLAGAFFGLIISLNVMFGSWYTVPEGSVGVVKRFGEAISAHDAGLHFKYPFTDSVEYMEIRTRKYTQKMSVTTTGKVSADEDEKSDKKQKLTSRELQMPSEVIVSANWNIPKTMALDIYRDYGSIEQFESRILDPRVVRVVKEVFPKYSIEEVISNRAIVTDEVRAYLGEALLGTNVTMTDVNLEDIAFPKTIEEAVQRKQTAKLDKEAEQENLAKQKLEAQRIENTATSEAAATRSRASAEAEAITLRGKAEAGSIRAKADALRQNPAIIQLTQAEKWDGKLPTYMMGNGANMLFQMPKN